MKIKNILIAQPNPNGSSPYIEVQEKYGLSIDFVPFIHMEGVTAKDFRAQRITILDHTAVVFTSRMAIDSYFRLCEDMRITIPETMKYFCITEAIALYLQKYIVYRKRKISFGQGSVSSLLSCIGPKHKNERFLLALADNYKPELPQAFEKAGLKHSKAVLLRTVYENLSLIDTGKYQLMVFYSPADVKSLLENFPGFEQKEMLFATFGTSTAQALKEAGYTVAIEAPTPQAPSIARALMLYLDNSAQ